MRPQRGRTASAPPIPRTLTCRLSVCAICRSLKRAAIASPSNDRSSFNEELIRNAIETSCNATANYFIHNRVESIYALAELVETCTQSANRRRHGQMAEKELESVMLNLFATKPMSGRHHNRRKWFDIPAPIRS